VIDRPAAHAQVITFKQTIETEIDKFL